MKNCGPDAYLPKVYGTSITIERKISGEGHGSYTLKDSDGRMVSRASSELANVLDTFNVQVENPLMILNQDVAREFLTSKDPSEMYKFFMKGTLLEQISCDYTFIRQKEEIINKTLSDKKVDLLEMKEIVKALGAKVKEFEVLGRLQEQETHLRAMHGWALVEEKEHELKKQEGELEKAKKKIAPVQQHIADTDVIFFDCSFFIFFLFS